MTFATSMTIHMGKRRVDLMHLGRAHTAGDIVAWVPDAGVMFTGDIVEYHSACYCGDAHFADWPGTLDRIAAYEPEAIAPGRGDALIGRATGRQGHRQHPRFRALDLCARRQGGRARRLAEGGVGRVPGRVRSEVRQLRHLRALPAVQRGARL